MLNHGKNIRIFENPLLEQFTYVHPVVPVLMWGPISGTFFLWSVTRDEYSFATAGIWWAIGLFFWTFAEYTLHRFVFHFKPSNSWQARIAFLIHGVHHEDPNDARRLLMPPMAGLIIAVSLFSLFWLVLGDETVKPFFSGFLVGYLIYDYTHFAVHHWRLKGKIFKSLRQNHMLHHFSTPDARYGVSNTLWDYVFGTR